MRADEIAGRILDGAAASLGSERCLSGAARLDGARLMAATRTGKERRGGGEAVTVHFISQI